MRDLVRRTLVVIALGFLAWEAYAAVRWIRDAGGLGAAAGRFWDLLRSDWMLAIVVTDQLVIAGVVLVLLWIDSRQEGWSPGRRLLLAAGFITLGTPAFLTYLAWRLRPRDVQPHG